MTTQGNEISRTLPLGVETTGDDNDFIERKSYDAQGRLDYEISFEGVVTDYVYDTDVDTFDDPDNPGDPLDPGDAGRLVATYYFNTATDHANWLDQPATYSPAEAVFYAYNALGQTVSTIQDADADRDTERCRASALTTTAYDAEGRVIPRSVRPRERSTTNTTPSPANRPERIPGWPTARLRFRSPATA